MGKNNLIKRRDYFIKKWAQFKFSLIFILVIILGNTIYGTYVFSKIKDHLDYYLYASHSKLSNTWEVMGKIVLESSLWSIVIFFVIFLTLIFFIARRLSKNLGIISSDTDLMASGDLTGVCVAKKAKTTAKLFAEYIGMKSFLASNISETKEHLSKLYSSAKELEGCSTKDKREEALSLLKACDSYLVDIENNISKINT